MATLGRPYGPGCCAYVPRYLNSHTSCDRPVVWAGAIHYTSPRPKAVRAFACDDHKDLLDDPRPFGSIPEHEAERRRRASILDALRRREPGSHDAYMRLQRGG